jgi:uncharacterized protein (DUF302 family)
MVALAAGGCTPGAPAGPEGSTGDSGLIILDSPHTVNDTLLRLETAAKGKGLQVFGMLDLSGEYGRNGAQMEPNKFIVVGNTQADALLLNQNPGMAIMYPLKILVWQDAGQKVHLGYLDPKVVAARFGITGQDEIVQLTADTFASLAQEAVATSTLPTAPATLAPGEVRTLPPPTGALTSTAPAAGATP